MSSRSSKINLDSTAVPNSIPYFFVLAAACGRRHCVEWFLSNTNRTGNERNKLGSSPLHLAALNGHLEVVKLLVRG